MNGTEKIILGTAQLGLSYGINNTAGKPGTEEVFRILDLAHSKGIFLLDTAEAYGNAINLIGKYHRQSPERFEVISKFKFSEDMNLKENVTESLEKLYSEKLFAYLLHDADKLPEPTVAEQLDKLKQQHLIKYSGVSVYTNEQFEQAIQSAYIDIIQIPYNLLDNHFLRGALIEKAKAYGKIIHTRSVFLQGLFFMQPENIPEKLRPLGKYISRLNNLCEENSITKESLALNYAIANKMIDGVLAGVESAAQLSENIAAANKNIAAAVLKKIDAIKVEEVSLLNPANWN